ncbi:MAG: hypothetical protein IT435_02435 [Phycisphaerales bacterium]|nr:hypothetical protein [Phycisphaerales bacterium]
MLAPKDFPPPDSEDGKGSFKWRTDAGRIIRLRTPGPPPHEGTIEVFEPGPKSVCRVDSDLRVLAFLVTGWLGGN